MFEHSKIKVAFCAKEVLKKEATVVIDEKNLMKIMEKVEVR